MPFPGDPFLNILDPGFYQPSPGNRAPNIRKHGGRPPSSQDRGNGDTRDVYIATMFVGGEIGDAIARYAGLRQALDQAMESANDLGYPLPNPLHHWCIIVGDYLYELVGTPSIIDLCVVISYECHPVASESWTKSRIGVTTASDEDIKIAAQQAIAWMPRAYHLFDNNCQHFVVRLADQILRDPRNKYLSLKAEFISAHGIDSQRSEPTEGEQGSEEEDDFEKEEEDVVPIVPISDADTESDEGRRKIILNSITDFMVEKTPSIQESEAIQQ